MFSLFFQCASLPDKTYSGVTPWKHESLFWGGTSPYLLSSLSCSLYGRTAVSVPSQSQNYPGVGANDSWTSSGNDNSRDQLVFSSWLAHRQSLRKTLSETQVQTDQAQTYWTIVRDLDPGSVLHVEKKTSRLHRSFSTIFTLSNWWMKNGISSGKELLQDWIWIQRSWIYAP